MRPSPAQGLAVSKLTLSGGLGRRWNGPPKGSHGKLLIPQHPTLFSSITPVNSNPVYGPNNGRFHPTRQRAGGGCTKWSSARQQRPGQPRLLQRQERIIRQKGIKLTASFDLYHADLANYGRMTAADQDPRPARAWERLRQDLPARFPERPSSPWGLGEADGTRTGRDELELSPG